MKKGTFLLSFTLFLTSFMFIGLAGCSSQNGSEEKDENNIAGDFDIVVIETMFGDIEIKEKPKRVVALGWGDAETALSLGVEPVGASDWLALGGDGVGVWLEGYYTEKPEILGTLELDYEAVAALKPDLILDVKSSGDKERFERLSEIATTVGVPIDGASYLTSTEDQVRMIAKALGKEEEGESLLADLDEAFAKTAAENPHFTEKTISVASYSSQGFGVYLTGDSRVDFLNRLGFKNNEFVEVTNNDSYYTSLSDEQLEYLDADLTIVLPIWVDYEEIVNNELFQKIPSVTDGRFIILDEDIANAFSMGTVPALIWTIGRLPNELNAVLE